MVGNDPQNTQITPLYIPKIHTLSTSLDMSVASSLYYRYKYLSSWIQKQIQTPITSIRHAKQGIATVIGLIYDKKIMESSIRLRIEDPSGIMYVQIPQHLTEQITQTPLDCCIGITGTIRNGTLYANKIVYPNIYQKTSKDWKSKGIVICTGDWEIGSSYLDTSGLDSFIEWCNGKKHPKIKYSPQQVAAIIHVGDTIGGIGKYQDQQNHLTIQRIAQQYEQFYNYVNKIPQTIPFIVIPGNHDATRSAHPQPPPSLSLQPPSNMQWLSSPSILTTNSESPLYMYVYHGNSITQYANSITSQKSTIQNPQSIMQKMLQWGHIYPTYGEIEQISTPWDDPGIILYPPDIMVMGHTHIAQAGKIGSTVCISCGTFTKQTPYQKSKGIQPDTNVVMAIDLETQEVHRWQFK